MLRLEKGLTKKELSKMSGVSVSTIQRIEDTICNFRITHLAKITNTLEISLKNFFFNI